MASSPRSFVLGLVLGLSVSGLLFLALGDTADEAGSARPERTADPASEPASRDEPTAEGARPRTRGRERPRRPRDGGTAPENGGHGDTASATKGRGPEVPPNFDELFFEIGDEMSAFGKGGPPSSSAVLHDEWQRALAESKRLVVDGKSPDAATLERLIRSDDGNDVAMALVRAVRSDPPVLRPVFELARDAEAGVYRALALLALAEAGGPEATGDEAFEIVRMAVRSDDVYVREAAAKALGRFGKRGQDLAMDLLREGAFSWETADLLAWTIARARRNVEFLRTSPPAAAGLPVLKLLGQGRSLSETERAELARAASTYIRQVRSSDHLRLDAAEVLQVAAAFEAHEVLSELAAAPDLAFELREAAALAGPYEFERKHGRGERPADAARYFKPLAGLLGDHGAPVDLLREVFGSLDARMLEDPAVRANLISLSSGHANAWVRNDASAVLARFGLLPAGRLRIVKATYGKNGKTVDVTQALQELVSGGRLSVRATNGLGGDPLVGTVKDLRVEYVLDGRRRVRTVTEGQVLVIP